MVRLQERKIDFTWLEQAITQPDPDDPAVEHRLAAIAQRGYRVLRVDVIREQLR